MGQYRDDDGDRVAKGVCAVALIVLLLVVLIGFAYSRSKECADCSSTHQATSCSACDSGHPAGGGVRRWGGSEEERGSYGRLGSVHVAGHGR